MPIARNELLWKHGINLVQFHKDGMPFAQCEVSNQFSRYQSSAQKRTCRKYVTSGQMYSIRFYDANGEFMSELDVDMGRKGKTLAEVLVKEFMAS